MKANTSDESAENGAANAMSALLRIHSAATVDWLVDAVSTAAESMLSAPYVFTYFQEQDRPLRRKQPASDLRRRSLQRALDAFGRVALPARIDAAAAPAILQAVTSGEAITASAEEVLAGLAAPGVAAAAQGQLGVTCVAFVPLRSSGERVGALLLMFVSEPDAAQVQLFANHVALAAVNLRQQQAARETAMRDAARSVFDARKLESDLQKELARTARYRRQVSIAVVEATNVGLLREKFGPFLTDQLLQRLGAALAQNARDFDVIGAYKESGYTMILTEASAEHAGAAASRLFNIAQETRLATEDVPGLELHLVYGWATSPVDGLTSEALFAAADRRMYDAAEQVA